ncbi:MAG: pyruvoyl-dependent arginine decarboxylase [Candidatus Bathyarchaeaceae archaeon]
MRLACLQGTLNHKINNSLVNAVAIHNGRGIKRRDDSKRILHNKRKAISPVSELNAFGLSLKKAGIAQCNLVSVSSILPQECKERKRRKITAGAITYAVIARMDGDEGTTIGAGIAWAWEKERKYGIVAEAHGYMDYKGIKRDS